MAEPKGEKEAGGIVKVTMRRQLTASQLQRVTASAAVAVLLAVGPAFGGQSSAAPKSSDRSTRSTANELLKLGVYNFHSQHGATVVRTSTRWSSLHSGDSLRIGRDDLRRLLAAACARKRPLVTLEVMTSKGPEMRELVVRCLSM